MHKKIVVVILVTMLSGCANRMVIRDPGSGYILHDRVVEALKSDLPAEQKVQVVQSLLERENDRGANLTTAWKDILAWLATAGIIIAK